MHFSLIHLLKETSFGIEFLDYFLFLLAKKFLKQCVYFSFTSLDLSSRRWCYFPVEFPFNSLASPLLYLLTYLLISFFKESKHMCQPSLICSSILLIIFQVNAKVYAMQCLLSIDCPLSTNSIEAEEYMVSYNYLSINGFSLFLLCGLASFYYLTLYKQTMKKMYSCSRCIIDSCEFRAFLSEQETCEKWQFLISNASCIVL